jgi:small nuclear ribonucleoprotein D3
MATGGTLSVGVPVKLLHEGEGHVVSVELKNGEMYRGTLVEAEDTMNVHMKEVTMTARDGRISRLENVFLRGGHIKFIVLPELLKSAPILKKIQGMKSKSDAAGGDKAAAGGMGAGAKKQKK